MRANYFPAQNVRFSVENRSLTVAARKGVVDSTGLAIRAAMVCLAMRGRNQKGGTSATLGGPPERGLQPILAAPQPARQAPGRKSGAGQTTENGIAKKFSRI